MIFSVVSGQSNSDVTGLLSGTSQLAFLGFSRSQEKDADNEAILLSHKYYQHIQGANELFEVLLAESNQATIDSITLLSSHPEVLERINVVKSFSQKNNWAEYGLLTLMPRDIIELLVQDKLAEE